VVVIDDEDRKNEGDPVFVSEEDADRLDLPPMSGCTSRTDRRHHRGPRGAALRPRPRMSSRGRRPMPATRAPAGELLVDLGIHTLRLLTTDLDQPTWWGSRRALPG
jgi:hypothetical protein